MEKGRKKMKRFVTFEGIDGSGKSTISKLVYKKLKSNEHNVILTYEPTDTWIGKQVQRCIESNTDPFITAYTFIADRLEHVKQIKKWLNQGKIVLCDRYAESTYAYQGVQMEGIINDPIHWLKELSKDHILKPNRTFVFIIDPGTSLSRIKNRHNLIPFERVSFLEKVQNNYLKLAVGNQFLKVDATKEIEELIDICYCDILS